MANACKIWENCRSFSLTNYLQDNCVFIIDPFQKIVYYSFFRKLFILGLNWTGKSLSAREAARWGMFTLTTSFLPPTLSLPLFRESNGYLTDSLTASPAVSPDPAAGQQQDTTPPVRTPGPLQQRRNSSNSHSQAAAHQQKQHYRNSSLGQQQQQPVDHHPLGSTTPAAYPHHRPLEPSLSSENTVQQLFLESVLRGGEQISANRGSQQQQQGGGGGGVVGRKTSSHSRQASLGGGRQETFEAPPQQQQDPRHAHNNNNNNKTRTAVVGGDEEGKPQKKKLGVIAALRQSFRRASKKSAPRQQPAQGSSSTGSLGYLGRASTTSLAVTGRADSQLTPQLSGGPPRLKESYSNISVASVKTGRKSIVGKLK